jgi:hypothetical protein
MSAHTEGPWIATPEGAITTKGGAEIAHVFEFKNLPLLAAAPELLASINYLLGCSTPMTPQQEECWISLRAAAAKATGATP